MNKEKLKLDMSSKDWIRCQSKSHTGRFYMFNKATGETKWCSKDTDTHAKQRSEESSSISKEKKDSSPKIITARLIKTPAQDRLKRLQSNLLKDNRELKERNGEKSSKKDRIKSSQSLNMSSRKDATNKLKQAFMTDKSILPCEQTSSTISSKSARIRSPSKPSTTATPSASKTYAAASTSKTVATASSSKRTASPSASKTATASSSRTAATADKNCDAEDSQSVHGTSRRLSFYGRRLRLSTESMSLDRSIADKQNSKYQSPDKTSVQRKSNADRSQYRKSSADRSPYRKSSADRSPGRKSSADRSPHRKSSADRSPHRKSSADRSPHRKSSSDKSPANDSSDGQSTEKSSTTKSSPAADREKRILNLKRRSIKKSTKRLSKRRRLSMHKTPHFNPMNDVTSTTAKRIAEDSSSDEAITSSDASINPTRPIGFIDKLKAICKSTFRIPSTLSSNATLKVVKSPPTLGINSSLSSIQTAYKSGQCEGNEIGSNENGNKDETMTSVSTVLDDNLMLLPAVNRTKLPSPLLPPPLPPPSLSSTASKDCNVANNQVVPAYPRGSANSRLERLRQSLFMQHLSNSKNRLSDPSSSCTSNTELFEKFHSNFYNNNKNNQSNNNGLTNSYEPMDWQAIDDYPCINSLASLDNLNNTTNMDTSIESYANKSVCSNMSEYYDSVNANLMRFSAEQQDRLKWSSQKWLPDHYYFVIDTNVLLQSLTFIDDLIHMKLCDTNGTIVYIPYCVLQELDKLKIRSSSEGAKTLTVRAIKYLNKKLEECNKHIHAQSAMDERNHLIDVTSADDSILNCCLHVKRQVENVVLLTEDVNLRNKAICNNLLVTTKSDLISKHPEPSTPSSIWHVSSNEDARQ